jgi:hypothetical protein
LRDLSSSWGFAAKRERPNWSCRLVPASWPTGIANREAQREVEDYVNLC